MSPDMLPDGSLAVNTVLMQHCQTHEKNSSFFSDWLTCLKIVG